MADPLDLPDADGALAPTRRMVRREWRMALELASTAVRTRDLQRWPQGDGHPVIVLPGFLAGPESTVFLRSHLRRLGYRAHDWRQGRNLGVRPGLTDTLEEVLLEIHDRYGRAVSLVGWSAGGIYAREMARALPDYTRTVITLGSPFRGNPSASRAWRMYTLINRGDHHAALFTEEARMTRASPLAVPTTCIYSRADGIVAWECCTSVPAPQTENIEVRATHLGYGHEYETLRIIADRLAQPEGAWEPYAGQEAASPVDAVGPVDPPAPLAPTAPAAPLAPTAVGSGVDPDEPHEHGRRARGKAG